MKHLGVLTAGGDCPGLNALIRSVVKTAINDLKADVTGIEDGYEGLANPGILVIGVPRTIDNDLEGTDVTFGFDTAVRIRR